MKGVSGIISAILLIIIMISAVSVMMYMMNITYEQQQVVQKYMNDFISSPKAFQVGSSSVTSDGPLEVKYVIYPNGQVEDLSQPFNGMTDLSGLLNGNPWVYVVLSNGQAFNITQPQSSTNNASSNISLLSLESQVPYYVNFSPVQVTSYYTYQNITNWGLRVNPTGKHIVYENGQNGMPASFNGIGLGSVAVVPTHTGNGWLNFTVCFFSPQPAWYARPGPGNGIGIMFENESDGGTWTALVVYWYSTSMTCWEINYEVFEQNPFSQWSGYPPTWSSSPIYSGQSSIFTYWAPNNNFTFRYAVQFQEGQPVKLYVWVLNISDGQWIPIINGATIVPANLVPDSDIIIVPGYFYQFYLRYALVYNITSTV